jgi:hypothetical protein
MDTYLTLSGMWEIPTELAEYTDGYKAEITNEIPQGI